jgi:hypothetical protein
MHSSRSLHAHSLIIICWGPELPMFPNTPSPKPHLIVAPYRLHQLHRMPQDDVARTIPPASRPAPPAPAAPPTATPGRPLQRADPLRRLPPVVGPPSSLPGRFQRGSARGCGGPARLRSRRLCSSRRLRALAWTGAVQPACPASGWQPRLWRRRRAAARRPATQKWFRLVPGCPRPVGGTPSAQHQRGGGRRQAPVGFKSGRPYASCA